MEEKMELKLTEKETKHPTIRAAIFTIINTKLRLHSADKVYILSPAEHNYIKNKIVPVKEYAPKKKDRYENEVGKYMGKRVVLETDE